MLMIYRLTSNRQTWILILAVALCARLVAGFWWQARLGEQNFFFGDSHTYWELAKTIAHGEPYQYLSEDARVFRTPGYPVLLSPLFMIYGDEPPVLAARVLNAVLSTISVALAGLWATQLFDARAGLITGWLLALYPGSIALGIFVLSEAPFCPLMLGQLLLWTHAWQTPNSKRSMTYALLAGLLAAAAVLMRPSWLLFTPWALALALICFQQRRRQLVLGTAVCVTLILGMLPWWIRNSQVTGQFVPTTLQVGASLYDGLNPRATGASDMRFVAEMTLHERQAATSANDANFEVRLDRRMTRESLAWASANPGQAFQLAGIKILRLWNIWPNEPAFRSLWMRLGVLLTYGPLLVGCLLGIWHYWSRGWPLALTWMPAIYLSLLHMIFVSSLRYREPAMMALAPLAAGMLSCWIETRGAKPPKVT